MLVNFFPERVDGLKPLTKIVIIIIISIALLSGISGFYEDWLWFKDLGYEVLFWTPIISKLIIQLINGTILFIIIAATLLSGRHAFAAFYNEKFRKKIRLVNEINHPDISVNERKVTISLLLVSAVFSIIVSFIVGFTGWLDLLSFSNSSPFNYSDPLFNKDLSFYVFKLPFFVTIYNAFFSPILIITFFTAVFYVLTGLIKFNSIRIWQKNAIIVSSKARKHLGILLTILFILKAFGYYLDIYKLVYSELGQVVGAGYTDIFACLPALKVLIVLCSVSFVLAFLAIFVQDSRLVIIPVPVVLFFSILLNGLFPYLIQSLVVIPNELQKESPYIANEIRLTRFAYGLDKIEEREYPGDNPLSAVELQEELATLNNIRLNDPRHMIQIYTQKQGIRPYYKYNDIDIDRYHINGEYRQVMISPREISIQDVDPKAQTFINTRFRYTHGYGITASFANAVTAKGLPAFAASSIPMHSSYPELSLTEPRIYFGELTNDWVVVNTRFQELDYPQGSDYAENIYQGKTGITLTPFNKLMLSIHRATPRFYLAREVTSESRILLYRNIKERVQKLAPFLKYDNDPYPVIDNGRIKWIIDAYTTGNIPYSGKYLDQNFNYIRNSVKAVIDAYDGTVDFYAVDYQDPILQTYQKSFPGVFKNISEMPYSLKTHLRYPETLFRIQAEMLNTFHMTNTHVFYNKEDAWSIAKEIYGSEPQEVQPYYAILDLPGEEHNPEFVLLQLFTPASSQTNSRNNLIAWLAARMDGENYGELILYKLPKNTEIEGPFQIETRIDQDPDISRQLALWNQKGSSVIRGNLLVLPLRGNFLFVEPIYLQSTASGSIPEMQRVIVAYEDKLTMANSLEEALKKIFGRNAPALTLPEQTKPPEPSLPADNPNMEQLDLDELLQQIKQIREMLDSLENQITSLINNFGLEENSEQLLSLNEDEDLLWDE
ncbi:MAG TPA: UPF0182 family protein [Peptococcaceae bacterium]|nr:UPF0182 family protein [Peptococcaceae bacterium]